jgi:glycosyltransferase involved in cell wall biosynthesis
MNSVVTQSLDIVVPVYNEEATLAQSIKELCSYCDQHLDYRTQIIIANNASTDGTLRIAEELARQLSQVKVTHLDQKGRGRALWRTWIESDADFRCYMDVDLSTDLAALAPLIDSLREGYDVAVGSRLIRGARCTRSLFRSFLSVSYNRLLRLSLSAGFSDAQCGFKAINRRVADELLPHVKSSRWFFDTELLVLAENAGYRIKDLPVRWVEDPDSRVQIHKAIAEDLLGVLELRRRLSASSPGPGTLPRRERGGVSARR